MAAGLVSWDERKSLRPSIYAWKGRFLSCKRWVLVSKDRERACEIEYNGRGYTVDYYRLDPYGSGTILTFSSVGNYDLTYRRIYQAPQEACRADVLAWVNRWEPPKGGLDGGIILAVDEWGNEVAV